MSVPFSHTLQSLAAQDARRGVLALTVILLLLAWLAWFVLAELIVYESSGLARLEVSEAVHRVDAPIDGRIIAVHALLDEWVRQGDVLFELDSRHLQLQVREHQIKLNGLTAEVSALQQEIEAVNEAGRFESQASRAGVGEARARFNETEAAARFTRERLQRLERMHQQGQVSEIELLEARSVAQEHKASKEAARTALTRLEKGGGIEGGDRRARLERLNLELIQIRGQYQSVQVALERIQYEIEIHVIRAPFSGRVGQVSSVHPGSVVTIGERMASLIPEGELKAVAQFKPSSAVGRIRQGQIGRLMFHGFPWTRYGTIDVTVQKVAREVRAGFIQVDLQTGPSTSSLIPIKHGMPAAVEIEIERLSPLALVLRAAGKRLTHQPVLDTGSASSSPLP